MTHLPTAFKAVGSAKGKGVAMAWWRRIFRERETLASGAAAPAIQLGGVGFRVATDVKTFCRIASSDQAAILRTSWADCHQRVAQAVPLLAKMAGELGTALTAALVICDSCQLEIDYSDFWARERDRSTCGRCKGSSILFVLHSPPASWFQDADVTRVRAYKTAVATEAWRQLGVDAASWAVKCGFCHAPLVHGTGTYERDVRIICDACTATW